MGCEGREQQMVWLERKQEPNPGLSSHAEEVMFCSGEQDSMRFQERVGNCRFAGAEEVAFCAGEQDAMRSQERVWELQTCRCRSPTWTLSQHWLIE